MSLLSEFVDKNTKDLQNLGGGKGSGGGSLIRNPLAGINTSALQSVADRISANLPNLDQDLMDPVENVVNQVTPTVESAVNTVTDVANTTSNVVQDIVNMDPSPPDYRNAPTPDFMPVVNDA